MSRLRLSRRDFVKTIGIGMLLASVDWSKALKTFAETIESGEVNIIWFEAQSCTGDTTALLEATNPDIGDVLLGNSHIIGPGEVMLRYSDAVMPQWGEEALEILHKATEGEFDPFVLVIEGSFAIDEKRGGPPGSDYYCFIGEDENGKPITCIEWASRLMKRAVGIVTVGTCASYGGTPGDKILEPTSPYMNSYLDLFEKNGWTRSPTGSVGFFDDPVRNTKGLISRLEEAEPYKRFIENQCTVGPDCKPAIAVPGCPANGDAILRVLANIVLWYKGLMELPQLDNYWRPLFIYGTTVHDQCPRAGSYAASDFRKNPGDPDNKCLFMLGCKGPVTHCPWNKLGWVNGVGGPTRTGGLCIGCTSPGFSDLFQPLYKPLPAPEPINPRYLTAGLIGGLTAGGITAYGLSMLREKSLKAREKELAEKLCEVELVEKEEEEEKE